MKASHYILVLILFTLGSCTSSLYTGAEYDDLYYLASDEPVISARQYTNNQIVEQTLTSPDYYDNIYTADTLISDEYYDAVDYDDALIINNNNYSSGYDYYDNYSYTGRLRRFHSNYFNPYWRDPFYFNYGYPSFSYRFGYGGFPYYGYNSYYMDPFYGYGGYYGDYYGSYYSGYYPGYYRGFGSYYSSYYSPYGGSYSGSYIRNVENNSIPYGRRERPSSLSSSWNRNVSATGSSRRDPYLSSDRNSDIRGRTSSGTQQISSDTRRTISPDITQQAVNPTNRILSQDPAVKGNVRTNVSTQNNAASARPEYNSTNRAYTPSYSNPRLSTRPSYNNSRVSEGTNSVINRSSTINNNRVTTNPGTVRVPSTQSSNQNRSNVVRSNSSVNSVQRRTITPSNSSVRYSTPSRSSSRISSGLFNNSSGSRASTPSRSISSGSVSRSSVSSGSSSSGSSSGSSSRSSSGSSTGRR